MKVSQPAPFVRSCASFQEVSMPRFFAGFLALVVLIGIGGAQLAERTSEQAAADLVLRNGKVVTVDARDSVAQAVAIAGGKIVAVGTDEEVRSRIGSATRVVDLHGRTATPGLVD